MLKKDIVPEEWREQIGKECYNCGANVNVTYRFIIPIGKVGMRTFKNAACLCERCARELDAEFGDAGPLWHHRRGPLPRVDEETAYAAFDKLANGEIGLIKCHEMLDLGMGTRLTKSSLYRKWMAENNIAALTNSLDSIAIRHTDMLLHDCNVGRIEYIDGTQKYIRYHYSEENDVVYDFTNKLKYPVPMTITELREKYLLKK